MLPSSKRLTVATLLVLVGSGVIEASGPVCTSPYCGPCFPERVSFGYFPTNWRRWPTARVEAAMAEQPQETPTLAEPETPQSPIQPAPGDAAPQPPDDLPVEPPFGDVPAKPPIDSGPIQLPFGDEPPPFDDAPPTLPSGPKSSPLAPFDPTLPPESTPSEEMPKPSQPTTPEAGDSPLPGDDLLPGGDLLPGSDLPPSMPDDDPFKDDLNQDPPPADPLPKSSTREALDAIQQQASIRWSGKGEPPGQLREMPALPLSDREEPPRLEPSVGSRKPVQPAVRENPLRSASRPTGRPSRIVPAASLSAVEPAPAVVRDVRWRSNPLRSK